ncbi:hypothetical protein BDM02DRAFT_3180162 [Thelephora ganbajun]|uniref:Uncharacterized protein n=1 Tax=Thelephora ganbajun TaxID=370292 RepID=A0ACB6ZFU0_THEGA|nr:hypothetical protein BDM02DRAFT_3180162 [Thelephora ganbajun]
MSIAADIPPYEFTELVPDFLKVYCNPILSSSVAFICLTRRGCTGEASECQIVCSQALGPEIYVGCSNGQLLRFGLQAGSPDQIETHSILGTQALPTPKPIEEIILVPCVARILVLSDGQLHFFTLPELDILPIPPIRNVQAVTVDQQALTRSFLHAPLHTVEAVDFCVTKKTGLGLFSLREKLVLHKDFPLSNCRPGARRTGPLLCIADKENFNLLDLRRGTLLPVMPLSHAGAAPTKPIITVIGGNEFLIVSTLEDRGLAVFISGSGDPVRGTFEYSQYPVAVSYDDPYLVALMPDQTLEIRDIETQSIKQIVPAPEQTSEPRRDLAWNPQSHMVPSTQLMDALQLVHTLISQIGALLELHRIDQAVALAEEHRKRLNRDPNAIGYVEAQELRFVHQRIGFACLQDTLFEDAGKHLFTGDLDPRILISYFPDLRGSLFKPGDTVEMFAGITKYLPTAQSVEDIIKNYSPYMVPDTKTAPSTAELNKILQSAALNMLESFLTQYQENRRSGSFQRPPSPELNAIVDTVYAKILARREKNTRLYTLIEESNDLVLEEVESDFLAQGQYNALCKLYERAGATEKQLNLWSKIADGQWSDSDIQDPLTNMFALLVKHRDRQLTQKWAVWLTSKDSVRAVKLITSMGGGKRSKPEDNIEMLEQLRAVDPLAASHFLEHLILQKRSDDRRLHVEFANLCLDQLFDYLADDAISKLWRAKVSGYRKSTAQSSFLSYFVSTTPDSEHKRIRLKTILFLQVSALLNSEAILSRLKEHPSIFSLEIALIEGKLGHHHSALTILVDDLHDEPSAEVYCTLGGQIVSPVLAKAIGESCDLQEWASLLEPQTTGRGRGKSLSTAVTGMRATPTKVDEKLKKQLITILLKVYMSGSEPSVDKTSRLLDTQAMNLDVLEILSMVPPDWPMNAMSTFLSRSLRRLLHSRHEGMITKNLSAGQNLEVAEKTWEIIREEGALIEEALEDDDEDSPLNEKVDEEAASSSDAVVSTSFNEKSDGLNVHQADVVNIHPDDHLPKDEHGQGLL